MRRCIDRTTGESYAVKIIDKFTEQGGVDIDGATRDEIEILTMLQGHRNISKWSSPQYQYCTYGTSHLFTIANVKVIFIYPCTIDSRQFIDKGPLWIPVFVLNGAPYLKCGIWINFFLKLN